MSILFSFKTVVVLDILSHLLTDQNQNGFANLHSEGTGAGSRAVLNSAERYGLYVGQSLADNKKEERVFISRENMGKISSAYSNIVCVPVCL